MGIKPNQTPEIVVESAEPIETGNLRLETFVVHARRPHHYPHDCWRSAGEHATQLPGLDSDPWGRCAAHYRAGDWARRGPAAAGEGRGSAARFQKDGAVGL